MPRGQGWSLGRPHGGDQALQPGFGISSRLRRTLRGQRGRDRQGKGGVFCAPPDLPGGEFSITGVHVALVDGGKKHGTQHGGVTSYRNNGEALFPVINSPLYIFLCPPSSPVFYTCKIKHHCRFTSCSCICCVRLLLLMLLSFSCTRSGDRRQRGRRGGAVPFLQRRRSPDNRRCGLDHEHRRGGRHPSGVGGGASALNPLGGRLALVQLPASCNAFSEGQMGGELCLFLMYYKMCCTCETPVSRPRWSLLRR